MQFNLCFFLISLACELLSTVYLCYHVNAASFLGGEPSEVFKVQRPIYPLPTGFLLTKLRLGELTEPTTCAHPKNIAI